MQLALPLPVLTMVEKIPLFTQLMVPSATEECTFRLSLILARILWLDSERRRITQHPENQRWQWPLYQLASFFSMTAGDLEERLELEYKDFHRRVPRENV